MSDSDFRIGWQHYLTGGVSFVLFAVGSAPGFEGAPASARWIAGLLGATVFTGGTFLMDRYMLRPFFRYMQARQERARMAKEEHDKLEM